MLWDSWPWNYSHMIILVKDSWTLKKAFSPFWHPFESQKGLWAFPSNKEFVPSVFTLNSKTANGITGSNITHGLNVQSLLSIQKLVSSFCSYRILKEEERRSQSLVPCFLDEHFPSAPMVVVIIYFAGLRLFCRAEDRTQATACEGKGCNMEMGTGSVSGVQAGLKHLPASASRALGIV